MPLHRREVLERVDDATRHRPWLADLLLAAALAAVLVPTSATMLAGTGLAQPWVAVLWAAIAVMHVAIAFRRTAPIPVFACLSLAELVLALAPFLHSPDATQATYPAVLLPSSLLWLIGAYTVSAQARRPWSLLSLITGIVGAALVTTRVAGLDGSPTVFADGGQLLFFSGGLLAAVIAAWALGRFRRLRADQVAALAERALRAEADQEERARQSAADERARIARELHDVIAHSVSVMVRQAEGGRYVSAKDPAAAATALARIAETGREALTDMRALLGVLGTETTPQVDPQPTVDDLPELVARLTAAGQPVRLRIDGTPRPLARAAHLAAYRLVQEALTNVVKHAGPGVPAEVELSWEPDLLRLRVTDQGVPAPATAGTRSGGRGLVGMRERLQLVGGRLTTGPAETGGFAVVGEIPTGGAPTTGGVQPWSTP